MEPQMKILLPVDGSPLALQAARLCVRMVREGLRASVQVANVHEPANLYEMLLAHDADVLQRISEEAAAHALQPAQAVLREAGLTFESGVATGDPAHTLIDMVESFECDLVVMGARGMSRRSAMLGSVAHEVLHAAKVPVLIVRAPAPEDDAESP
jgi:nucleotide-binding universal stress UspA family protein